MVNVAVLGAGIQGVCVALALSSKGYQVTLVDEAAEPMLRASLRNEGKVHLGFIFANDASFGTAGLMLKAATSFSPLIDSWLPGAIDWCTVRARPFTYLVMRDTLCSVTDLESHYTRIDDHYRQLGRPSYLGTKPDHLFHRASVPKGVSSSAVSAAYETAELPIDLVRFRLVMLAGLRSHHRVKLLMNRRVDGVARRESGFVVFGTMPDNVGWELNADAVINCTWEGRAAIDASIGMEPPAQLLYRLKYRVLAQLPAALAGLPSLTMVLGPYGDVVPMDSNSYLSWYPECRQGWSTDLEPPVAWRSVLAGQVSPAFASELAHKVVKALDRFIPGITGSTVTAVDAGVIVARGTTDVDDPNSVLHERHKVGISGEDGYFSIDTGKFGCAPLFADQISRML